MQSALTMLGNFLAWFAGGSIWVLDWLGTYFSSDRPGATLVRDFLFAVIIAAISTFVVDSLRVRREQSKRGEILMPMRLLLLDALSEANRAVFEYLQAFQGSSRKRLKTRVRNLQDGLSGFRGTMPDGEFGPGTERQVINFQRDYTRMPQPNGKADAETLRAVDKFADAYPFDFGKLKCPCGQCAGFGSGKDKGVYLHACPPSVSCPPKVRSRLPSAL